MQEMRKPWRKVFAGNGKFFVQCTTMTNRTHGIFHTKKLFSANCSSGHVEWMLIWQPRRKLPKRKGKQFCSFFENGKNFFLKKIHSLKLSSWSQRMEFCQPCGKWFSRSLIFFHSTSEKNRIFFQKKVFRLLNFVWSQRSHFQEACRETFYQIPQKVLLNVRKR